VLSGVNKFTRDQFDFASTARTDGMSLRHYLNAIVCRRHNLNLLR
jgi:hypothetical protein